MKYKIILIFMIVLFMFVFSQNVYAFEEEATDDVNANGEIDPSSITDPEQNIDDGQAWYEITYKFPGAEYVGINGGEDNAK